jgi:hypothetical protein
MPRQLVYLDESGDAGFKVAQGSSPVFVLGAVIIESPAAAEQTARAIHDYRASLGCGADVQFHFANLKPAWRLGFCQAVSRCPFTVRAVVMQKGRIWEGTELRRRGDHFVNFTAKMLFLHSFGAINEAKVFYDGEAGRESLRKMVTYLRQECNTPERRVIGAFKSVPKRANNVLLQLADMAVGAIARSYRTDKVDRHECRRAFRSRLADVWEFGRAED